MAMGGGWNIQAAEKGNDITQQPKKHLETLIGWSGGAGEICKFHEGCCSCCCTAATILKK